MLDSDIDMLYQYETKNINKAVKKILKDFQKIFAFNYQKLKPKI